jgi:hypothetical protein
MVDIPEALQHKLGPLEAWQWGALAGGAILVYRVVSSQGHQSTGVGTVTLTPNNQPDVSGAGQNTIGSILSGFAATGLFPDEFSITLPDGTVVTFKGGRVVSTTPPGDGTKPPSAAPGDGPGGGIGWEGPEINPLPGGRPVGPSLGGHGSPWFLPAPRAGGPVIPGANPWAIPAPRGGPTVPILPAPALPSRPGGGSSGGVSPNPLPGRTGDPVLGVPTGEHPYWPPNPLPSRPTGPATVVIPTRPTGGDSGGGTPGATPGRR